MYTDAKNGLKRFMKVFSYSGLIVFCLPLLALSNHAVCSESLPRPEGQAVSIARAPLLDGLVLNDPSWLAVPSLDGFLQIQPDEGRRASQRTEVKVAFTKDALYIGVIAYDDDPDSILVTDSRRDSSLAQTDGFQIIIDGVGDRQNGYVFGTNPAGIEYDGQVVKEGAVNLDWDGSWQVVAAITESGWSAEFEIPFTTLRYGGNPDIGWGMNFQRNIRRNNEIAFWAPLDRQRTLSRVSEAGTIRGISAPKPRNLQITPYVLGSARQGGVLEETVIEQEVGVDIKYSITPNLTLDATYNTDFAQVEVDDVVINLDRFSVFLPEKRPFFLENADQFSVGDPQEVELFFSRRIGIVDGAPVPIEGGLRLSGKVGDSTNVGLLYMSDDGLPGVAPQNDFLVARINEELPNRSAIGAMVVQRRGDGSLNADGSADENDAYAIDGRLGIGDNLLLSGWAAKTRTPGLDGDDHAFAVKANYDAAKWSSNLEYSEVHEDFNPEVGFLLRDDYKRVEAFVMRRFRPKDFMGLLEVRPHYSLRNYWDLDGFLETGFQHLDTHWEFRNGYRIDTGMNYVKDGLQQPFEIIDNVFIPAGTYSGPEAQISFNTDLSQPLSFQSRLNAGDKFGGDRVSFTPTVAFRIGETFSSELSVIYTDFDLPIPGGDFSVALTRLRLSYSFSPKALLQAVIQYNDANQTLSTNLRFALLRTANSGLYVVYNEFDDQLPGALPADRQFVIKYNYLFDVLN
ncbi:MAG: carbohydrate binding family 9 domain-containing protein [Congregibacter sp.]|nr:carbohydrate binding family 9 domain-containing protein [Congregibacter sp.]